MTDEIDMSSTYVDEYKPIPHRAEWVNLSVPQLIDIKNRLIGYTFSIPRSTGQHASFNEGIAVIDKLIANHGK